MLKFPLLLLMTAAAVVAVACSDDDDPTPTASPTPTATANLPADGNGGNGASGTFPAGTQPITIPEALAATDAGPLLVEGYLVITPDGARLCEALAESFPPQCGGDSLILDEPDPSALAQLTTEGDVSWTDQPVQMLGAVTGDTMSVQPLAAS